MSTDFVIMRGKGRLLKASRDGASLTVGFEPHEETTAYADEAAAIAAFQSFVASARRKGLVTNDEHHTAEAARVEVAIEPDRRRLLRDGERFGADAKLELRALGRIAITSGRLAARDPFLDTPSVAFARRVPKGNHRVVASLVTLAKAGKRPQVRCAAVTVHFAKGAVASLVAAPFEKQAKAKSGAAAYGVDAGTGAFMDASVVAKLDERSHGEIIAAMKKTRTSGFGFACLDAPSVIAFTSGLGDGAYASYWGFSRAKKLLCLMTDFAVVE